MISPARVSSSQLGEYRSTRRFLRWAAKVAVPFDFAQGRCHLSGYTGPRVFAQDGPPVFTQTGPPVFTEGGPLTFAQAGP